MNGLERWVEEELTRVPAGPSAGELRRRVRARRVRRGGAVTVVAIVLAVLGIVSLLQSPAPHRVLVTEPSSVSTTVVPTTSTLPPATTAQFPALAKIVNDVIRTEQSDSVLRAGPMPTAAEIVATTKGQALALGHASGPNPHQPVSFVQVIGDFVCNSCFGSPGGPHGLWFQTTYDSSGGRIGFATGPTKPPNISSLGTVYRLSLVRPTATVAEFPALAKMATVVDNYLAADSRTRPGSATPTAEIVETTRARAFPFLGGSVSNLASHIYIVQMIGNFVCDGCSTPAGIAQSPHGRALHVEFDADGTGYGFGVGPDPLDLGSLGTVYRFPL